MFFFVSQPSALYSIAIYANLACALPLSQSNSIARQADLSEKDDIANAMKQD